MTPRRNISRLSVLAVAAASMASLAFAAPASADPTSTTTPPTSVPELQPRGAVPVPTTAATPAGGGATSTTTAGGASTTSTTDVYGQLSGAYSTLSGALIAYYASQEGQSISQFLSTNASQLTSLLGPNASAAAGSLSAGSLAALDQQLRASGLAVDPSSYKSLQAEAGALDANSSSVDAKVVAQTSADISALARLHTGSLADAQLQVTPAGLAVGSLLDKSLAGLVTNFPNVFAQVSTGGLDTPAGIQAFDASMMKALQQSQPDFTSMLPSPCLGAMLDITASGSLSSGGAGGASCSGCASAGMYLHNELAQLINPAAANPVPDPSSSLIPPSELSSLPSWESNAIVNQNPNLSGQLSQSLSGGGGSCSTATAATAGALGTSLPGVFANLSNQKP